MIVSFLLSGDGDAKRGPLRGLSWSHDLAQRFTAWAEMNVGQGRLHVALTSLDLIPIDLQGTLLAVRHVDRKWLGLSPAEALYSPIVAALSRVGNELAFGLGCEIWAMNRDKHDVCPCHEREKLGRVNATAIRHAMYIAANIATLNTLVSVGFCCCQAVKFAAIDE